MCANPSRYLPLKRHASEERIEIPIAPEITTNDIRSRNSRCVRKRNVRTLYLTMQQIQTHPQPIPCALSNSFSKGFAIRKSFGVGNVHVQEDRKFDIRLAHLDPLNRQGC